MSGTLPPLQALSPENQGPVVVVVGYILVSVTLLCTTIRVITFHTLKRGFGLDDAYLSSAAVRAPISTKAHRLVAESFVRTVAGIVADRLGSASCGQRVGPEDGTPRG
jgi:hypothetical protein